MSRKIKLDSTAAEQCKRELREAMDMFYEEHIPQLENTKSTVNDLSYASISGIGNACIAANQALQKLDNFEKALSKYLQTIEKFDTDAATLIRNIPEIAEWTEHSGWNANPAVLEKSILKKLVDGGMTLEEADTFMAKYKNSLIGLSKSSAYCGDPINMSTGNFVYQKEDISITGSYPLSFVRFYNSVDNIAAMLGSGWTHNHNIFLKDKEQFIQIAFEDGHHEYYEKNSDGSYKAPMGRFSTLKKEMDSYVLITKEKVEYHFTDDGKIKTIKDANHNLTQFSYRNGLLCKVSNKCGSLGFEYIDGEFLHKVTDHTGRTAHYEYRDGCLVRAEQPNGAVYQYEYNQDKKIYRIINPAGVTAITNEYDSGARTTTQHMADGGKLKFCYEDESLSTISTEQNGNRVTYIRDQSSRTVKIVYSDSVELYDYDEDNNRTLFVDRNGNKYHYAYDSGGNLIKATDPLGNITSFKYNQFAKPLMVKNSDGSTVKFSYDACGNLVERIDPLERLWRFVYTDNGWPTQTIPPDKSISQYTYDKRGNITSITDPSGAKTAYEYNELNQVIKSVNAAGHVTRFTYNKRGDISRSTNAVGNSCEFEYSSNGKLIRAVDYCGQETKFTYNKIGKVEGIINAMGHMTQYCYDLMGNMTEQIDQEGNRTKYQYDLHNRLTAVVDPEGSAVHFEYDYNGNMIAVESATEARTTMEYDAMNRAIRQIEPDGAEISYEYDSFGRLISTTYQNGAKETRTYDKAGQLRDITNLSGETTRYTYTILGQVEEIISHNGDKIRYQYYPGGRLKCVTKPEGETTQYIWDVNGNVAECIDTFGNVTKMEYDALNRITRIINPQGGRKFLSYDPMGRVTAMTDVNGNTTKYRYSALGALLEVIDANGISTHYSYDAAQRLTSVQRARMIDSDYAEIMEAEEQRTTYEYNKRGNLVSIRNSMGEKVAYTYDANGRVIAKRDEEDNETLYEYNQIGQLVQTLYADGKQVRYHYGELRQLAEVHDWLGLTKIETTPTGQITKVIRPDGKTMGYEWTELGRRKKTIYPDGSAVEYAYNASGRLTQVGTSGGVTKYQYDVGGRLQHCEMPGDIKTDYSWDSLGCLEQLVHRQRDDVLDQFHYRHDPAGNIIQIEKYRAGITEDNGVFEYAYDRLNRLVKATHDGRQKNYVYDTAGNRVLEFDEDKQIRYTYNSRNQLTLLQDDTRNKEYRYDPRGNLTDIIHNGNLEHQYSYDAAGMLVRAISNQDNIAEYSYDGLQNRIEKNVWRQVSKTSESSHYFVDILKPSNNLMSMETDGVHNQNFIWGKGLLASVGDSEYTYLQDHLGSPMRLVESEANSTPLAFDEFGVPLVAESCKMYNPFGFTGYQTDDISGLYYAQARYYDPLTSRMTAADSWNGRGRLPQTQNKYVYCLNNPVALVDRSGNWAFPSWSELLDAGKAVVNTVAGGFADVMDAIPDGIVDSAKEFLTPHIDAANDFLDGVVKVVAPITQPLLRYGTYLVGEVVGHENLAAWGAGALDMKKDENGVYYADFDCWQRRFGYNDIYDKVFDLGTSMDKEKFDFSCGGEDFIFWGWRGDYLNLGAGAELGIYRRYSEAHWDVDQDLAMPMTLRILDIHGNQILGRYPTDPQWWVTGFNPDYLLMDAEEMIAIYTISMSDQSDMFEAFYVKYFVPATGMATDERLVLNPFAQMVTFSFMPKGMEDICIS